MAETRGTIREQLRLRIGEVTPGTWLDEELDTQIYNAEKKACQDCVVQTGKGKVALLDSFFDTPFIEAQFQYILPSNFFDVILLQQLHGGQQYNLESAYVAEMLRNFRDDVTTAPSSHYEVAGKTGAVLGMGVATGGSNTTLLDTVQSLNSRGFSTIDIVQNISDDSSATITAVTDVDTLTFAGGLVGGARNSFRAGDEYQVVEGEQTRDILWIYPPPSGGDVTTVESYTSGGDGTIDIGDSGDTEYQAAQSFQVDEATVVKEVEILLGASSGTPLGSITITIEDDSSGPNGAANVNAAANIESPSESAWNKAIFTSTFRLAASTTYWISAKAIDQDTDVSFTWSVDTTSPTYTNGQAATKAGAAAWSTDSSKDALFRLNGQTEAESLILHYARYPRQMVNDTDLSEIPEYAREAVYLYAEYLAGLKRYGRRSTESRETLALYRFEVNEVNRMLGQRARSEYGRVKDLQFRHGVPRNRGVPSYITLPLG